MSKSKKLKLSAGNPGRRTLNELDPQPTLGEPDCPAWLDVRRPLRGLCSSVSIIFHPPGVFRIGKSRDKGWRYIPHRHGRVVSGSVAACLTGYCRSVSRSGGGGSSGLSQARSSIRASAWVIEAVPSSLLSATERVHARLPN